MKDLILFSILLIFLFLIIFLDGMMLKRKKIVIQWRKFGLKRSCIFKVMNL